jgi:acetyltransferase
VENALSTRFLDHFFRPRSIAVIGGSEKPHSLGGLVIRNLQEAGFPGTLWAVNPKGYDSVFDVPCFSRVSHLPTPPDLAVICSPVLTVPGRIARLGRFGVKAALVLSGGPYLDDEQDGKGSIRSRMLGAARISGIRVLGPECMGLIVPGNKLNASYANRPVKVGRVAYLGQSGMLGTAMID